LKKQELRRKPVDQRTRAYLIRAHNKVLAHYRQILAAGSLDQLERERIQQRLIAVEAELKTVERGGASDPTRFAHAA
jgi:hypothetical protein